MKLLKLLVAGVAVGVIVIAFRDVEAGNWIAPPLPRRGDEEDVGETEPILGYDGMDVDTLLDWFEEAAPDRETLVRMRGYEAAHLAREAVLGEIDGRL